MDFRKIFNRPSVKEGDKKEIAEGPEISSSEAIEEPIVPEEGIDQVAIQEQEDGQIEDARAQIENLGVEDAPDSSEEPLEGFTGSGGKGRRRRSRSHKAGRRRKGR